METSSSSQPDAVVKILITSDIKNTKPLVVHRKMSQRLRDVRLAWCKRQDFDAGMTSRVFLTWKGRRLFDVTTCKSLDIGSSTDSDWTPGDDRDSGLQIHVEAVTEDLLASRDRRTAEDESNQEKEDQDETTNFIRITLKSPDFEEFRIKVKPSTRISRIVNAFRSARNIPLDKHVHLVFDGETLSPDSSVEEHDVADLDLIDISIK